MSETGTEEAGTSGLVDEAGNRVSAARPEEVVEPLVRFAKEQPLAVVLGVLSSSATFSAS
jgi:hypothetical protein